MSDQSCRSGGLFRQTQLALQFMKPRIGTQSIQLRVNFEKDDSVGVVGIGFFKPVQGALIFAQACVHDRHVERRNILSLRLLQLL